LFEELKIVLLGIFSAVFYGIIHDQVTVRVCLEYFTVFHPRLVTTQSPTILAFVWGTVATWWVGTFLGLLLALAARSGSRPKLLAVELVRPVGRLLLVMASCVVVAGLTGFVLAKTESLPEPIWMLPVLGPTAYPLFMADSWAAHLASYASGFAGGFVLCFLQYRRRSQLDKLIG
jgi:hypothetical protein